MPPGPTTLSPGTAAPEAQAVVPDHTLVQLIGRGSYGEVWLARNVMGTMRAVKLVQRRAFEEERPYEREFLGIQNFEPVSRSHEGLVDVLQVGRNDKERYFYYIMELADDVEDNPNSESRNPHAQTPEGRGERGRHSSLGVASRSYVPNTLAQEIARRGRLPVEECVRLGLSLAGAVAHLHNHGLIHRDIKPSNIIFVNGVPKLADIGLVSEAGSSRSYVGTEGYIPPEGPGTPQADLYSLGKLIYEASTGKDRTEFPALPLEVTRPGGCNGLLELNSIFLKACVSDPRDRYQSAEQMQHDLTLLQVGKSVRRLQRMERQVKLLTRAGVMGSLVTVLALGGYAYAHRQARLQRESAARIERAEREGRAQLRQALLAQAQALRQSGQGGRRFESLKAISKAAAISVPAEYRPASIKELRNEATACLALADLRATPLKPGLPSTNITVDLDLDRYAIADSRGAVQVRRLSNNELVAELPGQTKAIEMLFHFSPNGQFLPISYQHSPALIWDLSRGAAALKLQMDDNHFRGFDFSPDSRRVVICSEDLSLDVYDVLDGAMLTRLTNAPYAHCSFSPDGRQLLAGAGTNACIIQVESGELVAKLPLSTQAASVAWQPDGRRVAIGDWRDIFLWTPSETGRVQVLSGHQSGVVALAFHPEGRLLASSSWDGTLRIWDLTTGRQALSLPTGGEALRFTHDGQSFGSYWGLSHWFTVFEIAVPRIYRSLGPSSGPFAPGSPRTGWGTEWSVAFSPDERLLAAAGYDGVRVWTLASGLELAHLSTNEDVSVFFHPDGQHLFASGADGLARWPVGSLHDAPATNWPPMEKIANAGTSQRACISPRGDEVAYARSKEVCLLNSGLKFDAPMGAMWMALSPDAHWVATSGWGDYARVRLWNVQNPRQVRDFDFPSAFIAFTPDSEWLVVGSGPEFCFWNVRTGEAGRRITRKNAAGFNGPLAFSSDGKMLAIALSRTEIQLLDASTFEELVLLQSPSPQMISWLAFSPSGHQLAVATATEFIQVWDLAELRHELAGMGLDWQ